jgi:pantothenate kinase-related protein Tda10
MIDSAAVCAVLAILLPSIKEHQQHIKHPFVLGLSGLQGSGKSTWAVELCKTLSQDHGYHTRALSIDDLYHDHQELVAMRRRSPENRLLRTRGQPGTHEKLSPRVSLLNYSVMKRISKLSENFDGPRTTRVFIRDKEEGSRRSNGKSSRFTLP